MVVVSLTKKDFIYKEETRRTNKEATWGYDEGSLLHQPVKAEKRVTGGKYKNKEQHWADW